MWTDLEEILTTDRPLDLVEVIKFRELRAWTTVRILKPEYLGLGPWNFNHYS